MVLMAASGSLTPGSSMMLDDDAALAFALDDRLREAERVDALFHDRDDAVHGIVIDLRDVSVLRFKHDMRAALQVEALPDGIRQRLHEREEDADNRHDTDDEFQETVFSQLVQSLPTSSIPSRR